MEDFTGGFFPAFRQHLYRHVDALNKSGARFTQILDFSDSTRINTLLTSDFRFRGPAATLYEHIADPVESRWMKATGIKFPTCSLPYQHHDSKYRFL